MVFALTITSTFSSPSGDFIRYSCAERLKVNKLNKNERTINLMYFEFSRQVAEMLRLAPI
jgi:hypothetical protein